LKQAPRTGWAACALALVLAACGGGGGGENPQPAPVTQDEAARLTGRAVMDVLALAWSLSFDIQNTMLITPSASVRTEHQACRFGDTTFGGVVEAQDVVVTRGSAGTDWSGSVRFVAYSIVTAGSSPRARVVTTSATGFGVINDAGLPLTLQLSGLSATRTPSALGRDATLASPSLRVQRIPVDSGPTRDRYALEGCTTFTASGLAAELCLDAGSQIGLVENVADEQLTGRLRWNAGTPAGFDARLRITPAAGTDRNLLRIELDLDGNGRFEVGVTLNRSTDLGLRL
jgi:hypothetical protein